MSTKKDTVRIEIILTSREAEKLRRDAKRSGMRSKDYRRLSLLSGLPASGVRREEDCWEADTLGDIRAGIQELLRRQLKQGGISGDAALLLLRRLEQIEARRRSGGKGPWSSSA